MLRSALCEGAASVEGGSSTAVARVLERFQRVCCGCRQAHRLSSDEGKGLDAFCRVRSVDVIQCQVVSVEEVLEDCGVCKEGLYFVLKPFI